MISSNGHSQRRFIVTLRVLALVAAIPIIGLREELSSDLGIVCLTTFFYLIPYVLVTIAPVQWMSQQIGLAVGYSLSMFAALVAYLVARSFGFPTTVAPVSVYKCALVLNAMLFVVGLIMWIVQEGAPPSVFEGGDFSSAFFKSQIRDEAGMGNLGSLLVHKLRGRHGLLQTRDNPLRRGTHLASAVARLPFWLHVQKSV